MILIYDIVLLLCFIPVLLLLALRSLRRKNDEFAYKLTERLGNWDVSPLKNPRKPLLWFHCASVGEVRAIEPLIKTLDEYSILLTTLTPTGNAYAIKSRSADFVYLAPIDFTFVVEKVLSAVQPRGLVLVETEFWPGLIWTAKKHGLKLFLANARLSKHSFGYYRLMKPFWKRCLANIDRIGARSPEDAERFMRLGVPASRITVTGNIKYDRSFTAPAVTRAALGFRDSDILLVAGSTRTGEEEILFDAWLELRKSHPELKIAVAPRHLHRVSKISATLDKKKVSYARFSSHPKGPVDCLLVDTFGDLQKFYAVCDIAFVGGSFVNKGGQNPIEPAAYSKPVLFGPSMHNFQTEAAVLEEMGGGFRVKDGKEFSSCISKLITGTKERLEAGKRAQEAVESQKGALARSKELLRTVLAQS